MFQLPSSNCTHMCLCVSVIYVGVLSESEIFYILQVHMCPDIYDHLCITNLAAMFILFFSFITITFEIIYTYVYVYTIKMPMKC